MEWKCAYCIKSCAKIRTICTDQFVYVIFLFKFHSLLLSLGFCEWHFEWVLQTLNWYLYRETFHGKSITENIYICIFKSIIYVFAAQYLNLSINFEQLFSFSLFELFRFLCIWKYPAVYFERFRQKNHLLRK